MNRSGRVTVSVVVGLVVVVVAVLLGFAVFRSRSPEGPEVGKGSPIRSGGEVEQSPEARGAPKEGGPAADASSQELVSLLANDGPEAVITELGKLAEAGDASGVAGARKLLESEDDEVWITAAAYLGSLGKREAVPYLIKALAYPDSEPHPYAADFLREITAESYGENYGRWAAWYRSNPPEAGEQIERVWPKLRPGRWGFQGYRLITEVLGPTVLASGDDHIVLVGVRVKEGADKEKATRLLKTLTMNQGVNALPDSGPTHNEQGELRAFVYWAGKGDPETDVFSREGLPDVPFSRRTLINAYLLRTQHYELDPESVQDEQMLKVLKRGTEKAPVDPMSEK